MIRVVLACDGQEGMFPCRQAAPVGVVETAAEARRVAGKVHGWSTDTFATASDPTYRVHDLCPACTKRAQQK